MKIVNLTPHDVRLLDTDGKQIAVYPSAGIARATSSREVVDTLDIDGVPVKVHATTFGQVEGLPEQQNSGVYYIVSAITARAAIGRNDLLLTDDTVRDAEGRIIGCRAFAKP